jgi:hypothetical protein
LSRVPSGRVEGTFQVKNSARADGVVVSADSRGPVSQAGAVLLWETMRVTGLARGLSAGLARWRAPRGTPPTRLDSRTPSHGRRPKIDPSRTPQTRTATSRNLEVKATLVSNGQGWPFGVSGVVSFVAGAVCALCPPARLPLRLPRSFLWSAPLCFACSSVNSRGPVPVAPLAFLSHGRGENCRAWGGRKGGLGENLEPGGLGRSGGSGFSPVRFRIGPPPAGSGVEP